MTQELRHQSQQEALLHLAQGAQMGLILQSACSYQSIPVTTK